MTLRVTSGKRPVPSVHLAVQTLDEALRSPVDTIAEDSTKQDGCDSGAGRASSDGATKLTKVCLEPEGSPYPHNHLGGHSIWVDTASASRRASSPPTNSPGALQAGMESPVSSLHHPRPQIIDTRKDSLLPTDETEEPGYRYFTPEPPGLLPSVPESQLRSPLRLKLTLKRDRDEDADLMRPHSLSTAPVHNKLMEHPETPLQASDKDACLINVAEMRSLSRNLFISR